MQATTFKTRLISTPSAQDSSFAKIYDEHWSAYKTWYTSKLPKAGNSHLIKQAEKQLIEVMPEIYPIYEKLKEVTNDCPVAVNFLSGYQPPAYLVNCSQAVLTKDEPILIRNYDLSPSLSENLITKSQFLEQEIIGTNECLWGFDDGMNSSGLAASLTFGGSKKVGKGFGIPFIMRYVLETCETVSQAIKVLQRVPSHMAYNITLIDKQGDFATVMIAPEQEAIVTTERCITNHQKHVTWPEQASFSKTIERKEYLDELLKDKSMSKSKLVDSFLKSPLRSSNYAQQFGTVFTAIYQPEQGTMAYHWPDEEPLKISFDDFVEQEKIVDLEAQVSKTASKFTITNIHNDYQKQYSSHNQNDDSYDVRYSDAGSIPMEIRENLLMGLEYLPSDSCNKDSSISKLRQLLKTDKKISWVDYGNGLAAI